MKSKAGAAVYRFMVAGVLGATLSLAAIGCTTRQTRSVETSGFLGDYSQLEEGEGDEALLVYINPKADFSKYDKIIIDSVSLWANENLELEDLTKDEQQALTDYFYNALHRELRKDYEIAVTPGEGVLRFRAAITEAEDANVTMDVITTVVPQLRLLTTLGGLTADAAVIVGEASLEGELLDSLTGERLAAAVDKRVGAKSLKGVFSDWADVQAAYDAWAERIRVRLKELRTGEEE